MNDHYPTATVRACAPIKHKGMLSITVKQTHLRLSIKTKTHSNKNVIALHHVGDLRVVAWQTEPRDKGQVPWWRTIRVTINMKLRERSNHGTLSDQDEVRNCGLQVPITKRMRDVTKVYKPFWEKTFKRDFASQSFSLHVSGTFHQ